MNDEIESCILCKQDCILEINFSKEVEKIKVFYRFKS